MKLIIKYIFIKTTTNLILHYVTLAYLDSQYLQPICQTNFDQVSPWSDVRRTHTQLLYHKIIHINLHLRAHSFNGLVTLYCWSRFILEYPTDQRFKTYIRVWREFTTNSTDNGWFVQSPKQPIFITRQVFSAHRFNVPFLCVHTALFRRLLAELNPAAHITILTFYIWITTCIVISLLLFYLLGNIEPLSLKPI